MRHSKRLIFVVFFLLQCLTTNMCLNYLVIIRGTCLYPLNHPYKGVYMANFELNWMKEWSSPFVYNIASLHHFLKQTKDFYLVISFFTSLISLHHHLEELSSLWNYLGTLHIYMFFNSSINSLHRESSMSYMKEMLKLVTRNSIGK